MGWEFKNDMKGQADHGLKICNVKIKYLPGAAEAHFLDFLANFGWDEVI